jgi:hypothetical protein
MYARVEVADLVGILCQEKVIEAGMVELDDARKAGRAVEYYARRVDGGGVRWVAIGDTIGGQAIATSTGGFLSDRACGTTRPTAS